MTWSRGVVRIVGRSAQAASVLSSCPRTRISSSAGASRQWAARPQPQQQRKHHCGPEVGKRKFPQRPLGRRRSLPGASAMTTMPSSTMPLARSLSSSSAAVADGKGQGEAETETVSITFVEEDGTEVVVDAAIGKSLLEVAHDNDVDLEGACGGDLACSTCHLVLPPEYFAKLPSKHEEEDDMLDLAWGLTDTSRLGCQVKVTKDLAGLRAVIPAETIDAS